MGIDIDGESIEDDLLWYICSSSDEAFDFGGNEYRKDGDTVSVRSDREYVGMMEQVSDDLEIDINATNTDDHVPEAERNNRTIKERERITYYRLPYKAIP